MEQIVGAEKVREVEQTFRWRIHMAFFRSTSPASFFFLPRSFGTRAATSRTTTRSSNLNEVVFGRAPP
jgi:hypothetical protein